MIGRNETLAVVDEEECACYRITWFKYQLDRDHKTLIANSNGFNGIALIRTKILFVQRLNNLHHVYCFSQFEDPLPTGYCFPVVTINPHQF